MSETKTKPSHIYSSISVAIVMFLLGIFVLVLLHSHNLTNILKEKMNIVVELSDDADEEKIKTLMASIPEIREESIRYIPKEDALVEMSDNLNVVFPEGQNPFKDVILFNVKADKYSIDNIKNLKSTLETENAVSSVYYEDLTIDNIKSNLNKVAYAILSIGLIFVFLAIIIIRNTINLSMYADRWEIKTMELIGAKWRFIKMPYIKTSVLVGFRAFIIASLSIMAILIIVQLQVPQVWEVINFFYILLSLAVIFVLSILIPAITTNTAATKYLNKNMDALYD